MRSMEFNSNPKERNMSKPYTVDRGPYRILVDPAEEAQEHNQYFVVTVFDGFGTKEETLYVRSARIAFNVARKRYGKDIQSIVNLETGRTVVGGR